MTAVIFTKEIPKTICERHLEKMGIGVPRWGRVLNINQVKLTLLDTVGIQKAENPDAHSFNEMVQYQLVVCHPVIHDSLNS